jgi:sulfur carrier protein ThiS
MLGKNIGVNFNFIAAVTREESQKKQQTVDAFDSAAGDAATAVMSADDQGFNSELAQLRRTALHNTFQLSDDIISGDLEEGELPSDRLDAFLAPEGDDGDDENAQLNQQIAQILAANMADAMASLGVDDETIAAAFDTDIHAADEAIEKLAETIEQNLPTGEALDGFITSFLYGEGELDMNAGQVDEFDSAEVGKNKVRKNKYGQTLVYKGVKAVRQGKVTVVNKRVGNTSMKVKLSAKQKMALRKAGAKAVTPNAIKKRLKSITIGRRNGLYGKGKGL